MRKIIVAKNISKSYGGKVEARLDSVNYQGNKGVPKLKQIKEGKRVLNGIDFIVSEGDFICIMGSSGAGKSTFLNILATLDRPTGGSVEINNKNTNLMNEEEISKFRYENIGFIFQEFNLIDALTIRENISAPLILADKSESEIDEKIKRIAEKLCIAEILDKFPAECSGGEKQRAASARALVSEPRLIVADEPTGNLDVKNSYELLEVLKERNEKDGIAILMVTHDSMIASYSKKVVFLRSGKIEEIIEKGEGTQEEFFHKIVDVQYKESKKLFNFR